MDKRGRPRQSGERCVRQLKGSVGLVGPLVLEVCSVEAQSPGEETACRETVLLRTEEYQ